MPKTTLSTKEKHRAKIVEYCANPDNEFPTRSVMAQQVIGFKDIGTLYFHFTPAELCEIEREALEIRRSKYSPEIAEVDKAMLKEAKGGNTKAAKLVYQRLEGWSEKLIQEHSGDITLRVVYDEAKPVDPND